MALEVRLYGKLRRIAPTRQVTADSVVHVEICPEDTIETVLARLGLRSDEVSNVFYNGELSAMGRRVADGGRLGVFPEDMGLLYSWYFDKKE